MNYAKKITALSLTLLMLAGCSNTTPTPTNTPDPAPSEDPVVVGTGLAVKTGLYFDDTWGITITNLIEEDGKLTGVLTDTFRNGESSKEHYDNYGVKPISTIGKEWWEQIAYYEDWVVENGIDAVEWDENGHATVDLISGATINVVDYTEAAKVATADTVHEIAGLTVKTGTSWNDTWGLTIANVIEEDDQIIGVIIDTFRDGQSSKEKFDNYGVKSRSTIGKEWWEQVKFYENWVVENGVDAVEYDEDGHSTVDSLSGATINISNFTQAILNALGK